MTALALSKLIGDSRAGSSGVPVSGGAAAGGKTAIPRRELWLHRNKAALQMVRDGIEDARQGRVRDLGSFAQYADDVIDD